MKHCASMEQRFVVRDLSSSPEIATLHRVVHVNRKTASHSPSGLSCHIPMIDVHLGLSTFFSTFLRGSSIFVSSRSRAVSFRFARPALPWASLLFLIHVRGIRTSSPIQTLLRGSEAKNFVHHQPQRRLEAAVPEQIHLALADPRPRDTYAMSVSWLTWEESSSQVFWGVEAEGLTNLVTGNFTSEDVSLDLHLLWHYLSRAISYLTTAFLCSHVIVLPDTQSVVAIVSLHPSEAYHEMSSSLHGRDFGRVRIVKWCPVVLQ